MKAIPKPAAIGIFLAGLILALPAHGLSAAGVRASGAGRYFVIQVVDARTGRGVPLVELKTVDGTRFYTDSNGIAAVEEPGLEGQETFFFVRSHGYEVPADGFGYRGVRLRVKAGQTARIEIRRLNIAERLYRVTGQGIYRDSVLAGRPVPLRDPVLNAQVVGSDSVLNTIYHGRLFWVWGDTSRPGYPLGNFNSTAATSDLPQHGGLAPDRGVDLHYFVDKTTGFVRGIAPVPGAGPTWLDALLTLNEDGKDRLFAAYAKVHQDMTAYERGLLRFDDAKQQFEKILQFDRDAPLYPRGHPFKLTDHGVKYLYFANPYPLIRVRADAASLRDPSGEEAFTCLQEGSRFDPARPGDARLDRDEAGRLRYGWKRNTSAIGPGEQKKLIDAGRMTKEEGLLQLQDPDTGKPIYAHAGSVYWNAYRKRWIMITTELGGSSLLGEVWYAEAPAPVGPWVYARKIVTHDRYSFYNPKQDPFFDQDGGRLIYFEGTYSHTFSGNDEPTPRYDYNQMMYRLDLSDPRLSLPVPVAAGPWQTSSNQKILDQKSPIQESGADGAAAFFAPDRPGDGLIPVYWQQDGKGPSRLVLSDSGRGDKRPAFYALSMARVNAPPTTAPLYEFVRDADSSRVYGIEPEQQIPGFHRLDQAVCRVWKNPCRVRLEALAP